MSDHENEPERIDAATTAGDDVAGVSDGNPIAGVEIDEDAVEEIVEPDDNAFEVDGPQAGHA